MVALLSPSISLPLVMTASKEGERWGVPGSGGWGRYAPNECWLTDVKLFRISITFYELDLVETYRVY
jgi:hypothetical protein